MYIRCPKCGRRGYLPDRLVPGANSLRCRRCQAQFLTPELARLPAERGGGPAFDSAGGGGRTEQPEAFLADGFFSGFDDHPGPPRERGPGDSNYELTFTLHELGTDPGTDWDAPTAVVEPEAPSSDEIAAVGAPAARLESDSWPVRFLASWGLALIGAALGLIVVSVPLIAYWLWRAIGGAAAGGPSPTLIAGFACAVALVMISIPMMLLATCLTDLVRDVRRLREHLERTTGLGR
jgi:zinc-ribbon domain